MYYRLASVLAAMFVFAALILSDSYRMAPYWLAKHEESSAIPTQKFEPLNFSYSKVMFGWSHFPNSYLNSLPIGNADAFSSDATYDDAREDAQLNSLKLFVEDKLPDGQKYAAKLSDREDSITLPMIKQPDGTYATTEFIALVQYDRSSKNFYGVRVFHIGGEKCSIQVGTVGGP